MASTREDRPQGKERVAPSSPPTPAHRSSSQAQGQQLSSEIPLVRPLVLFLQAC